MIIRRYCSFVLLLLIFWQVGTAADRTERPGAGGFAVSPGMKQSTEAADINYQFELFPGQHFTGYLYFWSVGVLNLNGHFSESPQVSWLNLVGGTFSSNMCEDVQTVLYQFDAPLVPGVYQTTVVDDSGHYPTTNVQITVTESPTILFGTVNAEIKQDSILSVVDSLRWTGFTTLTCIEPRFIPSITIHADFSIRPPLPSFVITPQHPSLPLDVFVGVEKKYTPTDTGLFSTYMLVMFENFSHPRYVKWNIHVSPKDTLKVVRPSFNKRFIAGEQDTIEWKRDKPRAVELYFSSDNGQTYTFMSVVPETDSTYVWTPPDFLFSSSNCRIKVADFNDASVFAESERFTFRAYDLVKELTDGSLRTYDVSSDSWTFINDTIPMWPSAWWSQFDYRRTNDPYTHKPYPVSVSPAGALAFMRANSFPDWPLFVDAFTFNQCYTTSLFFGDTLYEPDATLRWVVVTEHYGGSCNGLATGSLLGFAYPAELRLAFDGMPFFSSVNQVQISDDVRKVLNQLQIYQSGTMQADYARQNEATTPRETLAKLRQMLLSDTRDDDAILAIHDNINTGGHAVLPYKIERVNNNPGVFTVYVYDPNNPGNTNAFIEIDSSNNRWTDHLPGLGFGTGSKGCYLDVPASTYLSHPLLLPGSSSSLSAQNTMSPPAQNFQQIYCTIASNIVLRNASGDSIGFRDSSSYNNIPDAGRIIPLTGRYSPPVGYTVPSGSYSVAMDSFTDSAASLTIFQPNTVYRYERTDADVHQKDRLVLGNGMSVVNPDAESKQILLTTITKYDEYYSTFNLSDLSLGTADSLNIVQLDPDNLKIENFGNATAFDLSFSRTDSSGLKLFNHHAISLSSHSTQRIVVDTGNIVQVKILIDHGNDGAIDDSLIVDNQVTDVKDRISDEIPREYSLDQNYPNPFNPTTSITYGIPNAQYVSLKVYNVLGQEVVTLVDGILAAGEYNVPFDASQLPSGVYYYRLTAGSFTQVKKMVMIK